MLEPGDELAGYVIERRLGDGGMGEVYVARHPRLPRSDAIKVLGAQVRGDGQFRARFHREAELAARLSHPAIVQVYDQGEHDGRLWISMQLIDGTDVGKRAAHGPISVSEVARIISTVADALDFAGARGLVHRDVKPANILISAAGHVMLTDFGIARLSAEASDLTGTGMTVGTLNYASPEQLQGEMVDTRSDQYSLAATAYHLLAGSPPFADSNAVKVITGHLSAPVPPLGARRPGLPAAVDEVLVRGLSKDPAQRFASSREFAAALGAALTEPARHRGRSDPTIVVAAPTTVRAAPLVKDPQDVGSPVRSRSQALSTRIMGVVTAAAGLVVAAGTFGPWVVTVSTRDSSTYTDRTPGLGKPYSDVVKPGGDWKLLSNGDWYLGTTDLGIAAAVVGSLIALTGVLLVVTIPRAAAIFGAVLGATGVAIGLYAMVNPAVIDFSASWNGTSTSVGWGLWVVIVAAAVALCMCAAEILANYRGSRHDFAGATQTNVRPGEGVAPVTVAGAKPESWAAYVTGTVLISLWWIAVLVCAAIEQTGIAIFLGLLGVFLTAAFVRALLRITSAIGREQATADQRGIRTPRFSYRWHEVLACDFIEQSVTYNGLNTRKTTATKEPRTSLIVTLRETDTNGRPVQHGYTLTRHHTDNTSQLLSATQHFAPDIQIRAELNVGDYASTPRGAAALQLARDQRIEVLDHRGRPKITLTNNAIAVDTATIPLSQLTAVVAVTDVLTNSTYGWKTSERIQRLVLVSNDVAADGTPNTVRIDYPAKFAPPLEQFLPAVSSLAPHIDVRDRRTVT